MIDRIDEFGIVQLPVKPELDQEVLRLRDEAVKLREFAEARVIVTQEDFTAAVNDMSMISTLKKALEGRRVEYVKPLNEHVKGINADFKVITEPIEKADQITRAKMLEFQNAQEARRQEEERINAEKIKIAEAEMALKGEMSDPLNLVPVTAAAPKTVTAEAGSVGRRMVKKWELEDLSQVPVDYLILDTTKINKVVKAGIPAIPGIRIFEEAVLTVRASG